MRLIFVYLVVFALGVTGWPAAPHAQSSNWILQQQRQQQMMQQQRMQQQRQLQQQRQMEQQRRMQEQRRQQQQAMQQRQRQMQQRQQQLQAQRRQVAEQRRLQQQKRQQEIQRQQAQRQQVARQQAQQNTRIARNQALQLQRTKRLQELRQRTRIKDKQDKDRKEAQKTQSLALLMRQGTRATTSHALRSRQAEASARLGQLRSTTSPKVPAQRQADQAAASQQRQRIAQQKVQEFRKRKSEEALKKAKLDQPRKGQLLLAGPGKDRRAAPGTASHSGELPRIKAGETWLKGQGTAGKVPLQIAEKMQGRQFTNFDHFRREFWKEVHKDKALRAQFSVGNQQRMAAGKAPFAPKNQQVGKRQRYELDHVQELRKGGNVYDMNNLFIRSPLNHIKGK